MITIIHRIITVILAIFIGFLFIIAHQQIIVNNVILETIALHNETFQLHNKEILKLKQSSYLFSPNKEDSKKLYKYDDELLIFSKTGVNNE